MFPYVEVRGTHEEAGFQLGKLLKQKIKRQLKACDRFYRKKYNKSITEFHLAAHRFLPFAQKYLPQYVLELECVSRGADVAFDDLLVLMCEEEIVSLLEGRMPEKCTTIGAKCKEKYLLLHNEDYEPYYTFYVVNAKIDGEPPFLGAAYMGTLPGSSASFNPFLGFSGNAITAIKCKYGVPKNFLLRAMCAKKSLEEVIALWNTLPRAIGTNSVFVTNEGIYDLEMSADKTALFQDKILLYHTNHIIHPLLEGTGEAPSTSSYVRYTRLKELFGKGKVTLAKLIASLKDHKGICRHEKDGKTLCMSIIDMKEKSIKVYEGNPCKNKKKEYYLS